MAGKKKPPAAGAQDGAFDLETALHQHIFKRDRRYAAAAYYFLYEALGYTQEKLGRRPDNENEAERHVTGQELIEGIRLYAQEQFGRLAPAVFRGWGLKGTEDFGEMVFNLVQANLMSKTESDTRRDFADGFNFDEAFDRPIKL